MAPYHRSEVVGLRDLTTWLARCAGGGESSFLRFKIGSAKAKGLHRSTKSENRFGRLRTLVPCTLAVLYTAVIVVGAWNDCAHTTARLLAGGMKRSTSNSSSSCFSCGHDGDANGRYRCADSDDDDGYVSDRNFVLEQVMSFLDDSSCVLRTHIYTADLFTYIHNIGFRLLFYFSSIMLVLFIGRTV